jgi:RNA polymerase sigma factor (sigma-70 family)
MDDLTPEQLFLKSLDLIERIAVHACRRSRLRPEDKEDFVSLVREKLLEDGYAVLRKFERRDNASVATFLNVVIRRLLLDYQNHLWGKWRNSAEAERLGEVAERLEELINRDDYTFDEACEILRRNEKLDASVAQLADLRAKLPPRMPRQVVGEEPLVFEPARGLQPDQELEEKELEGMRRRILKGLSRALDSLSPEDRLLIQMTCKFKVSEIARLQKLEQKPLYRRLDKIHDTLKKALERQGIRREDVKAILGCLKTDLYASPKKSG